MNNKKQPHRAVFNMLVGVARFELASEGVRVPCLTTWRHPKALILYHFFNNCQSL